MAADATTKVPLGATTLNRKWFLDINSGTRVAPIWVGVFGITEFKPIKKSSREDDSDFDGGGWMSETTTALAGGAELKLKRAVTLASATVYDPGQELLRLASDGMGLDNSLDIRFYEMNGTTGPKIEAYRQQVTVEWQEEGGGMDKLSAVSVTLTGQGKRTSITHPAAP